MTEMDLEVCNKSPGSSKFVFKCSLEEYIFTLSKGQGRDLGEILSKQFTVKEVSHLEIESLNMEPVRVLFMSEDGRRIKVIQPGGVLDLDNVKREVMRDKYGEIQNWY